MTDNIADDAMGRDRGSRKSWFAAACEIGSRFIESGVFHTALGLQAIGVGVYFHDPALIALGTVAATYGINRLVQFHGQCAVVNAGLKHLKP